MKIFTILSIVLFYCCSTIYGQNKLELASIDTFKSENIVVFKDYKKDGTPCIKATWCEKAIYIPQKEGEKILSGKEPCVLIYKYFAEGKEIIIPKKIIAFE